MGIRTYETTNGASKGPKNKWQSLNTVMSPKVERHGSFVINKMKQMTCLTKKLESFNVLWFDLDICYKILAFAGFTCI